MPKLTLDDLREMAATRNTITPAIAANFMGCEPYAITCEVRDNPERVRFPYFWSGTHLKIMLAGFIRWAEGRGDFS